MVETNCVDMNDILPHGCVEMLWQNEPQEFFWFQRDAVFKKKGRCGPTDGFFITAMVFGLPAVKTKEYETYMSDHAYCFVCFPE